jgi:hypothetical protein
MLERTQATLLLHCMIIKQVGSFVMFELAYRCSISEFLIG